MSKWLVVAALVGCGRIGFEIGYTIQLRNQSATNTLRVDWVHANALASPPPVITIGPEL